MLKVLKFIWQLPQDLIGLGVIIVTRAKKSSAIINGDTYYYWYTNFSNFGVSLGDFVIIGEKKYKSNTKSFSQTVRHEHGHQIQSIRMGWLYLLLVGLPSATGNIYDRIAHKNWTYIQRIKWYYGQIWEHRADVLGKVGARW